MSESAREKIWVRLILTVCFFACFYCFRAHLKFLQSRQTGVSLHSLLLAIEITELYLNHTAFLLHQLDTHI